MSKIPFFTSKKVRELLARDNLKPLKRLGQHFLVSQTVLNKIIQAAELKPGDIVLEVGPGIGVLTLELAKRAKKVIAVEKDKKMARILGELLAENRVENVKVVQGDILKIQNPNVKCQTKPKIQMPKNYKVVANLPYNIATAVIMKFLESRKPPAYAKASAGKPELMVVMVQKEVAQRILSKPPQMNKLAVFCQLYSQPKIVDYITKTAFWPQPKVDSAILKVRPRSDIDLTSTERILFSKIVQAGFSHPRKQLLNNFSEGLECFKIGRSSYFETEAMTKDYQRQQVEKWLLKNNIKPNQRAETLTVDNWISLAKTLRKLDNN